MLLTKFSPLFDHKEFLRFWVSRFSGMMGSQMLMVALGWQMYDLTNDPWDLGLVGLFEFVPAFLLTLPAGHTADRYHRGKIFSGCMLLQIAVAATLFATQNTPLLSSNLIFTLAILLGTARAFQMPAQQALVPLLVPKPLLESAIALSSAAMQAAIVCGPAIGGIAYVFNPAAAYFLCAICFSIAFVLMWWLRYEQQMTHTAADFKSIVAGIHYVWSHKVLLGAISLDLFGVLLGGATALLPIFAKDILDVGPIGLGALRSAPAIGALVMSTWLVYRPINQKVGMTLLKAVGVFGLATVIFGISTSFWLSLISLVVTGAADSISVVTRMTLTQIETPDQIRGRVSAVNSIFIGASNQLGEFESGAAASFFGLVPSVVLGGLGTILCALLWKKWFPELANKDQFVRS